MPRILLIEDEAALRRLFRSVLESAGHEVEEAADGDEGLRAFRGRPADLVLCDLSMPGRSGLLTIPELRSAGARVVVVSGDGGVLEAAEALGADGALAKPFDHRQLLSVVQAALAPLARPAGLVR